MGISIMNESKSDRIKELYNEFWRRLNSLEPSNNKNTLDGGKSPQNEVLKWYQDEVRKIDPDYGVK